jgi:Raf kinase inhibitor-like YbhB/YbcL family protein
VTVASITVTSKSFPPNGHIPVDYTCDGKDISPQLTWSSPPPATKSLVVVVDDPDAPSGVFTHWVTFNLPADSLQLAEALDPATLGARVGLNDFGNTRYAGPCPPKGQMHRYRYEVIALDAPLNAPEGATRAQIDGAMNGHVVGDGVLYGVFSH